MVRVALVGVPKVPVPAELRVITAVRSAWTVVLSGSRLTVRLLLTWPAAKVMLVAGVRLAMLPAPLLTL